MIASLFAFYSCSEDDLDSESIFKTETAQAKQNEFDAWLLKNFTNPYNIRFIYRLEDMEADFDYTVSPADFELSQTLAKIVKYAWLEAYDEVAGVDFTRTYVPKIIQLIGSAQYNSNGTMVLGTAEGGLKVTLNLVNSLIIERSFLNKYYFRTMHHEFTHILNQTKNYDTDYDQISSGLYIGGDWYKNTDTEARKLGFIRNYSMSYATEDYADMLSVYVISTSDEWDGYLEEAEESGAAIITQKLEMIRTYMTTEWGIDIDELRDAVNRRMNDICNGKVDLNPITTIEY
jgi:substrate import-associated zinc metallohydrolase lipoprotein